MAHWLVLAAALLPYLTVGIAKAQPGYDNRDPRGWLTQQSGFRRRAHAAHLNHFEAFAPFAAAVLFAQHAGAAQNAIDSAAWAFLLCRIGYTAAYLLDWPTWRSILWAGGMAAVVYLFVLPTR